MSDAPKTMPGRDFDGPGEDVPGDDLSARERTPDEARAQVAEERLVRLTRRARLALFWEAAWPRLVPLLSIVALFFALSWLGVWSFVGDWVRGGILLGLGLAAIAAFVWILRTPFPSQAAALKRVERNSPVSHRPASGLRDTLSTVSEGPAAEALWAAHRRRLMASLAAMRAGPPRPDMVRRDPNALRFVVPVLLFVAFLVGWGEHWPRLADAFRPVSAHLSTGVPARIDAWVDPPTYTGAAPVYLSRRGERQGESAGEVTEVRVPQGSRLTVRVASSEPAVVTLDGPSGPTALAADEDGATSKSGAEPQAANDAAKTAVPAPAANKAPGANKAGSRDDQTIRSYTTTLESDGSVSVEAGRASEHYAFRIIPDRPPTIRRGEVTVNRSGSFTMAFTVEDDYGVTDGNVTFRPQTPPEKGAHPLVEAPSIAIRTGRGRKEENGAKASGRLEEHPYAGMPVVADAVVRDAAGQEGRPADDGAMTLPARPFRNPIAKALIEQRRELALDARSKDRVVQVLDAMTIRPGDFVKDSGIYLGLTVAYQRMRAAESDDELRAMLDYLWEMAVLIEDGELSEAQERLAEAREALEQALAEGASEEEISRLTEELRQAMNDVMRSMAEQMARSDPQKLMPIDPNAQVLSQQDLERMLDRIEDLARLGDKEAAQELLSQLQEMLDNMQMAQRMQQQMQSGEMGQMMQQMEELGRLMREQQRLMDDTFSLDQGQRPGQRPGDGEMSPSEMAEMMRKLQQNQGNLQEQLQALLDKLRQQQGQGQQPGEQPGGEPGQGGEGQMGQGERALDRAGRAMGEATGSLGDGEPGQAIGPQGEALQAMREGMQQMMSEMMGQQGQGGQQRVGRGGNPQGQTDPLGRPQRAQGPQLGEDVRIPDEFDVERARRILNAIRERLGERFRPSYELDYLERLLQRD
ncbi:TIGR02302 family protein [Afifella aestuarii]|uniref:TIGR02302 family protein n=1 Tax=Afifella aestuarii TaxID=1909496 RepID=UPI000FE31C30|nr:TIGR02302 family protein [Afifella aestuarii]